jgi:hypothetical protein
MGVPELSYFEGAGGSWGSAAAYRVDDFAEEKEAGHVE